MKRLTIAALVALTIAIALLRPSTLSDAEPPTPQGLPLLIHAEGELWYQPLAIYPRAVLVRLRFPRELAIRLPSAIAAALTVVLTYALAARVMGQRVATIAALMLLLMPAFTEHASGGGAGLMMVPPVLLWFICVLEYLERPRAWLTVVGGAALGTAFYTQPAGVLTVPIYFMIGAIALLGHVRAFRPALGAALGIAITLVPFALWFARYPATYPDTFGRWAVHAAHIRNPWHGLVAFTRWDVLGRRVGAYWDYLSPGFLFLSGVVFSVPMLMLIPLGLWAVAASAMTVGHRLIVAGFLAAPAAAVLLDVPRTPSLALVFTAFGAVMAARGLDVLLDPIVHLLNIKRSRRERA